jgi:hypothetical protein
MLVGKWPQVEQCRWQRPIWLSSTAIVALRNSSRVPTYPNSRAGLSTRGRLEDGPYRIEELRGAAFAPRRITPQDAWGVEVRYWQILLQKLLSISARNIDSKSRTNAQYRFKSAFGAIRLLQISIPQRPFGDFCNKIGTLPTKSNRAACPQLVEADHSDWHGRCWMAMSLACAGGSSRAEDRYSMPLSMA